MQEHIHLPSEGDLYKIITVGGHDFELRYGYYEENEREKCTPVVLFPDMTAEQLYCQEGFPLVTQVQDGCEHYISTDGNAHGWCGDCIYYSGEHREVGICRCEDRRMQTSKINSDRRK